MQLLLNFIKFTLQFHQIHIEQHVHASAIVSQTGVQGFLCQGSGCLDLSQSSRSSQMAIKPQRNLIALGVILLEHFMT